MANQKPAAGADLWFVTAEGTDKLADLEHDPHLNLSDDRDANCEWVSVSGMATISRDCLTLRKLYQPDWAMWFPQEGDPRHGTADDPRMVLIGVQVHAAVFLEIDKPRPVLLYELVNAGSPAPSPSSARCTS